MFKFLVKASLLSTALAGGYSSGGQSYGSGSDMSGGGSYQQGGQSGGGGSYQQGGQGGGSYQPPSMTQPMMESSTPCEAGGMTMHTVLVGGSGLIYTPEQIWAKAGDKVKFVFLMKNHTVTQSTFDKPCVKMAGGMDSGFMMSTSTAMDQSKAPTWEYTVMDEKPTWWYCRQKVGTHCGKGMTFAINPTKEKTFQMFKDMAMQQNGTMTGGGGSYSPPPPPPAETSGAPPPAYSMASGQGQQGGSQGGACQCSCFCGVASWPSGYGVGSSGGMPGMLPMGGSMEPAPAYSAPAAQYSAPPPMESSGGSYSAAPAQESMGGSYSGGSSGGY